MESIKEFINEYESIRLLKLWMSDEDIANDLATKFKVIDLNAFCNNCKSEPCSCHLISTI